MHLKLLHFVRQIHIFFALKAKPYENILSTKFYLTVQKVEIKPQEYWPAFGLSPLKTSMFQYQEYT